MWNVPALSTFKTFFARDFQFAPDSDANSTDFICDADISKAFCEANAFFNPGLGYGDKATPEDLYDPVTIAYLYLAAGFLVESIKNSSKGIASQFNFPVSSKSVGGVSVSYAVPDKWLKNPMVAMLSMNGYGLTFLRQSLPLTIAGGASLAQGTTTFG